MNKPKALYPLPVSSPLPPNEILKEWQKLRQDIFIDKEPFANFEQQYQFKKPDNYTNTRASRFKQFVVDKLITPIEDKDTSDNLQMAETLISQLHSGALFASWHQVLLHRLAVGQYDIAESSYRRRIAFSTNPKGLSMIEIGQLCGEICKDNEDDDVDIICGNNALIYQCENHLLFKIEDNTWCVGIEHASVDVKQPKLHNVLNCPCLVEEITHHIHSLLNDNQAHQDEVEILQASSQYLLGNMPAHQLQQAFISTNFYHAGFQQSLTHQLINKMLTIKPLPNTRFTDP